MKIQIEQGKIPQHLRQFFRPIPGPKPLDLCLIPQRLALALQADGWLIRSVVAWVKPAPMPQSVSGWMWRRCRVKVAKKSFDGRQHDVNFLAQQAAIHLSDGNHHAQWSDCPGCPKCSPTAGYVLRRGSWRPTSAWEPILMLAKSKNYYGDGEAVKTPPAVATVSRDQYTRILDDPEEQFAVQHDHETVCTGANLRDVWKVDLESLSREELLGLIQSMDSGQLSDCWRIAAEPLKAKHYASFPSELVYKCLASSTSAKGYCVACGKPWARVVETPTIPAEMRDRTNKMAFHPMGVGGGQKIQEWRNEHPPTTLGWRATCSCNAPTRPGLVLDPFMGSGRTGLESRRLGLDFVGVELNENYCLMARRLLKEDSPLFNGLVSQ